MKYLITLVAVALLGCGGPDTAPAANASDAEEVADTQRPRSQDRERSARRHDAADDDAGDERQRVQARAQARADNAESPRRRQVPEGARPLVRALQARLTVRTRHDGTVVYSRHCEDAEVGCRQRVLALASILYETAEEHDLDPFLLAALAVRESMLNPAALGRNGEAGILQLHPRGAGHDMRYVLDSNYRRRCQSRPGACQRPVVERAATYLSDSIESCGGLRSGLGRYASGRCGRAARHARNVLEERNRLRGLAR